MAHFPTPVQNGFDRRQTIKIHNAAMNPPQVGPVRRPLPPFKTIGVRDLPVYGSAFTNPGVEPKVQPILCKRPAAENQNPLLTDKSTIPCKNTQLQDSRVGMNKRKKKMADKILSQKVRDSIPESRTYTDLIEFERHLDSTLMRKRFDIHEALKRPIKQKRKLRIFISNTFYPAKAACANKEGSVAMWELRIEGRLLDDAKNESKIKRKFSSFFKSLVIELDKTLYGPDKHLVEWQRTPTTHETDGFQVKRPGTKKGNCTILLMLNYQPLQFKLDQRLARLLGVHTQTRHVIISTLWEYIKTHKLQDSNEVEYINCDEYLEQIFNCSRMKFVEIPQKLNTLLHPPEPIVINHIISVDAKIPKKTACYDIDVEVDDPIKVQMNNFLLTTASQQEIQSLDHKIQETVQTINQLKTSRDFFLDFSKDPQQFIHKWIMSQTNYLKTMTDVKGNPEEERRAEFYNQPWIKEAVNRYISSETQQKNNSNV